MKQNSTNSYTQNVKKIYQPWYDQEYALFIKELKKAILEHIKIFRTKNPDKKVYGYSLYTCNGVPHLNPVLNEIKDIENKDLYDKYCPDEWHIWDDYSCFIEVQKILDSLHKTFETCEESFENIYENNDASINFESEKYWNIHCHKIVDVMVQAIKELDDEGNFDWLGEEKLLLIWFSDPDDFEFALSKNSIKVLSNTQLDKFNKALDDDEV